MAKIKCPVKEKELEVPRDCSKDCVYLFQGECVNPLAGKDDDGGCSICCSIC